MTTELLARLKVVLEGAAEQVDQMHSPEGAIEQLDEALAIVQQMEPEQLVLPLWDERVQADAEDGIAWRYVGGQKVAVLLLDVDLLSRPVRLDLTASSNVPGRMRLRSVLVHSAGKWRALGRLVLERKLGRPIADGLTCDHIDNDHGNNRRDNLREATASEQSINRRVTGASKYLYVSKHPKGWKAQLWAREARATAKTHRVPGVFDGEVDAARAADAMAVKLFGPDARTNVSLGLLPPLEQLELL